MTLRPRRRMRAAPEQQEPLQRGGGEQVDVAAETSIRLAHKALNRFPELVRRHKYVAGGAAVAGALVVLASVALARRIRSGQSAEEAVASVTQAEIESLHPRERDEEADPPAPTTLPVRASTNGAGSSGSYSNGSAPPS